ncbi:hypothetical protein BH18THE2_BH18THE2_25830 [soil metagenome]
MKIFETLSWITLGFMPTIATMGLAWRTSAKNFKRIGLGNEEKTLLAMATSDNKKLEGSR